MSAAATAGQRQLAPHPEAARADAPRPRRLTPLAAPPATATARRPSGRVRIIMLADVATVVLALAVTYVLAQLAAPPAVDGTLPALLAWSGAAAAMWIAVFAVYQLYESQTHALAPDSVDEIRPLFHALLAGSLLLLLADQGVQRLTGLRLYTPFEAALFVAVALAAIPLARTAARTWLLPAVTVPRRTLIVGAGEVGAMLAGKLEQRRDLGFELVGFVDDGPAEGLIGTPEDLAWLVDELEVDWVVLAFADAPYDRMLDLVRTVRRPDVHISIVPRYFELFTSSATLEEVAGTPIVSLPPMRFSRTVRALKRTVDVVGAAAGLLVFAPVLAVAALAIKLDSPGPVLFRQWRNGRGGRPFRIVKLRTMVRDAERDRLALGDLNEVTGPLFKIRRDPRITRVGRFLRSTSIDEVPQLWNVLRGEMSLVGPRPFVVHEADQIGGWAARRLDITPGITGLWQVNGRNDLPFEDMVKLDYLYVTNWSLWWDLKILLKTIPVVVTGRGAY